MLEAELGDGTFFDCATCERPESHCQDCPITTGAQPWINPRLTYYMVLWNRLQMFPGTLPDAGGMLDQEEDLMLILETIGNVRREFDKESDGSGG